MIKTMIAIALAAGCAIGCANAQSFPSRPVTILVPLAAGGSTDTIGRIIAEGMRPHLGQPVIVENSPGAGGTTGVIRVARSAPDGYTRADRPVGHQCGERRGVRPADRSAEGPRAGRADLDAAVMIVGRKTLPPNNLKELIAWLKANPGSRRSATPASAARATSPACSSRTPSARRFNFVPYRSAGPASQDLLAGNIDMMMDTAATSGPNVRSGLAQGLRDAVEQALAGDAGRADGG